MTTEKPLWVPNDDRTLTHQYPTIDASELMQAWGNYQGADLRDIQTTPDVLGAFKLPQQQPRAFVSVDLCEVVRKTHETLRTVEGITSPIPDIHTYCGDTVSMTNYADIQSVAQVLMGANLIEPVDGIEEIAKTMQRWRKLGAFVFGNTSTLEGCEEGTVKFLARYLPGCLDGIVFARNFDGKSAMNKGIAAGIVIDDCLAATAPATLEFPITAIHIDDLSHHNESFHREMGANFPANITTIQPLYPSSHEPHAGSKHAQTPLSAFRMADQILAPILTPKAT